MTKILIFKDPSETGKKQKGNNFEKSRDLAQPIDQIISGTNSSSSSLFVQNSGIKECTTDESFASSPSVSPVHTSETKQISIEKYSSGLENSYLNWDIYFYILLKFKLIKNMKDFQDICNLCLVCKDFHQFIKNQLLPNARFTIFIQSKDLIINQTDTEYSVISHRFKGIKNSPIGNADFIFEKGFPIQDYKVINFALSFGQIRQFNLLGNFTVDLDLIGDPLDNSRNLSRLPITFFRFGNNVNIQDSGITLYYEYFLKGFFETKEDQKLITEEILKKSGNHTITLAFSGQKDSEEEENDIYHPCFSFREFSEKKRKYYGYEGWNLGALQIVNSNYDCLKELYQMYYGDHDPSNEGQEQTEETVQIDSGEKSSLFYFRGFELFHKREEELLFKKKFLSNKMSS